MKHDKLNIERILNIQILDFSSKETQEELLNAIGILERVHSLYFPSIFLYNMVKKSK